MAAAARAWSMMGCFGENRGTKRRVGELKLCPFPCPALPCVLVAVDSRQVRRATRLMDPAEAKWKKGQLIMWKKGG